LSPPRNPVRVNFRGEKIDIGFAEPGGERRRLGVPPERPALPRHRAKGSRAWPRVPRDRDLTGVEHSARIVVVFRLGDAGFWK
jgi:hypothetical protein